MYGAKVNNIKSKSIRHLFHLLSDPQLNKQDEGKLRKANQQWNFMALHSFTRTRTNDMEIVSDLKHGRSEKELQSKSH